jgi:hypothetical protein
MEVLLEISKWVEIEDKFTDKYGWTLGIDALTFVKREVCNGVFLEDLSDVQNHNLIKSLRKFYKEKEIKDVKKIKNRKS